MPELNIRRLSRAQIPSLSGFSPEFWEKVGDVVSGSILDNIIRQQQADGTPIKENAPSTKAAKQKQGRGVRSLIHLKDRFVQGAKGSWKILQFIPNGRGILVGPATAELRKLVRWVHQLGYVGWLGVNVEGIAAIRTLLREEIRMLFRAAKRGP